jgi:translation initiation factor IF-3
MKYQYKYDGKNKKTPQNHKQQIQYLGIDIEEIICRSEISEQRMRIKIKTTIKSNRNQPYAHCRESYYYEP